MGDLNTGRPNLGLKTTVQMFRLMQYTMRTVLVEDFGDEVTRKIMINAGKLSGEEFCKHNLDVSLALNPFLAQLHEKLLEDCIGILRVEKIDVENMKLVLTISEDLDCSGLPVTGFTVCDYDEGFLAGIFEVYTGKEFEVKEIDCWSTGDRTCRFTVNLK